MRHAAVSVDVDSIDCYYAIHGLGSVPERARHLVWHRAVPRFADLFARHGVKATFFVVGRDLGDPESARISAELVRQGHELGNHSESHPYDLVARAPGELETEVRRTHDRLGAILGRAPTGFRAPGYNVSARLFETLVGLGYRYDSSLFPSPPYYAAKAAVMLSMRVRGQTSRSHLGDPRQLGAPLDPYRPAAGAPWRRGSLPLLELPVTVAPLVRLPVIGTSLLVPGPLVRKALLAATRPRRLFNLELHGIELLDAALDQVPAELVARQPDLRRSLAHKQAALDEVLGFIGQEWTCERLDRIAEQTAS